MKFSEDKPIYLQIIDYVDEQILLGRWVSGERIMSVRELASALEVNPNTVMRSYNVLTDSQILVNQRGIGFYVSEEAVDIVLRGRKQLFLREDLPNFFKKMKLLGITMQDLVEIYKLTENE